MENLTDLATYLHNAHMLDRCLCDCCNKTYPKALIHEHHVIKKSAGGTDKITNILRLDAFCHSAVHQVESALKNPRRKTSASDLVATLFPTSLAAQKKCLELAAIAAMGDSNPEMMDFTAFDGEYLVYLTPVRVSPKVRECVRLVAKELKSVKTGKSIGVSEYIKGLIEIDLKKRGFSL